MAKIQLNGRKMSIKQNSSVFDILKRFKIHNKKIAVELNGKIVPKIKYRMRKLGNNDKIEIVHFIGGG